MKTTVARDDLTEKLRQHVIQAWQTGHGGDADQVHILTGDDGLALIIPKALYGAEIALFRTATNSARILDPYLRTILEAISTDLLPIVEEYTGKAVNEIVPLVDLKAGWITAYFRFIKPLNET